MNINLRFFFSNIIIIPCSFFILCFGYTLASLWQLAEREQILSLFMIIKLNNKNNSYAICNFFLSDVPEGTAICNLQFVIFETFRILFK